MQEPPRLTGRHRQPLPVHPHQPNVNEVSTYVAVDRTIAAKALNGGKVKGKKVKARGMEG